MLSLQAPTPQAIERSHSAFRSHRLQINRRYIRTLLTKALQSLQGVVVLGEDPLVSHSVARTGTDVEDIVVCQLLVDDQPLTILGVPKKIWFRSSRMERLLRAQRLLAKLGRRCVIIPQSAFAGLGDEAAARVLAAAVRTEDLSPDGTCSLHHRHDPVGCFVHRLGTGIACQPR